MSGDDTFAPLNAAFDDLTARLAPAERKKLAGTVATDLRKANAGRMKANVTPEGEAMVPRKRQGKKGGNLRPKSLRSQIPGKKKRIKTGPMFQGALKPRYLRKEATDTGAAVGFTGAMARIMRVHQEGLRDTVTRDPASPAVTYPERPVIGLTPDDRLRILDQVSTQIQP